MSFLRNGTLLLGFSALSLALAIGCSRSEDADESTGSSDITGADGPLQDLVISQVYGAGSNSNAKFQYDYVELFNQGTADVELAGKTIQYASAAGKFSKSKNILSLPASTAKLAPNHYFLIQLAGPDPGKPLIGAPLSDPDYVAGSNVPTQTANDAGAPSDAGSPDDAGSATADDAGDAGAAPAPAPAAAPAAPATNPELISMSGTNGKVALVANAAAALDGCGDTAANACDPTKYIDLVGYGTASQFRGTAASALSATTAATRRFDGCSHAQDNSVDFEAVLPAPRNTKSPAPSIACDKVDASAPPAPATNPPATKSDGGKTTKSDAGKHTTAGDDDDDGKPAAPSGDDDDDDTDIPSTKKKPTAAATTTGAPPPTFPATAPDCAMSPGPIGNFGGLGAVFGIALAGAALRRRRR